MLLHDLAAGTGMHCYYLTHKGLSAAAIQEQADPRELAQRWHADERGLMRLLPRIHQLLAMQDIINSLVNSSPTILAYPGGHRATIHWHWRRDYRHLFVSHRRSSLCRADAALVLHRLADPRLAVETETCYSLLLVVEGMIEMDGHSIRQRLDSFLRYRESRERTRYYQFFPPILVVVRSQHQRAVWQRYAIEAAATRRVKPLVGAVAVIPTLFACPAVWSLSWQHLWTSGPCRLQDLLIPQPSEALLADLMPPPPSISRSTFAKEAATLVRGQFTRRTTNLSFQAGQQSIPRA